MLSCQNWSKLKRMYTLVINSNCCNVLSTKLFWKLQVLVDSTFSKPRIETEKYAPFLVFIEAKHSTTIWYILFSCNIVLSSTYILQRTLILLLQLIWLFLKVFYFCWIIHSSCVLLVYCCRLCLWLTILLLVSFYSNIISKHSFPPIMVLTFEIKKG